jgi:hypothetical protein
MQAFIVHLLINRFPVCLDNIALLDQPHLPLVLVLLIVLPQVRRILAQQASIVLLVPALHFLVRFHPSALLALLPFLIALLVISVLTLQLDSFVHLARIVRLSLLLQLSVQLDLNARILDQLFHSLVPLALIQLEMQLVVHSVLLVLSVLTLQLRLLVHLDHIVHFDQLLLLPVLLDTFAILLQLIIFAPVNISVQLRPSLQSIVVLLVQVQVPLLMPLAHLANTVLGVTYTIVQLVLIVHPTLIALYFALQEAIVTRVDW